MDNNITDIIQHLFAKGSLQEVPETELKEFISQYPYSSVGHYLLARKMHTDHPGMVTNEIKTAALYINNPLWLEWLLNNNNNGVAKSDRLITKEAAAEAITITGRQETSIIPVINPEMPGSLQPVEEPDEPAEEQTAATPQMDESPIAFQSYHTVDYFASQGIKLKQGELSGDKLGRQLKSFTEWLRSMKKLPAIEAANGKPNPDDDDPREENVTLIAEHSIQEKEVLTETMAEVWAKQGNIEKARAVYKKLSLLNPHKNAYFATKIDQLNVS